LAEKRFGFKGSIPIQFANLANSWELAKPEKFPRAKINWTVTWLPGPWDFAGSSWLAEIIVVFRLKVMFLSKIQEIHHLQ
jgi:hypothetical protein